MERYSTNELARHLLFHLTELARHIQVSGVTVLFARYMELHRNTKLILKIHEKWLYGNRRSSNGGLSVIFVTPVVQLSRLHTVVLVLSYTRRTQNMHHNGPHVCRYKPACTGMCSLKKNQPFSSQTNWRCLVHWHRPTQRWWAIQKCDTVLKNSC